MDSYFGLHSFFYFRRPVKDEGDSVTAFESDVLGAPERLGVLIVGGAIVGSENDNGVVRYSCFLQSFHHFADPPIHFLHDIPSHTIFRGSLEWPSRLVRGMRIIVCEIKEERFLFRSLILDDLLNPFRIQCSQLFQGCDRMDDLVVIQNFGE